jgi:hypothetical protein
VAVNITVGIGLAIATATAVVIPTATVELRLLTAGLIAIATAIAPAAGAADRGCNLKVYVNRSGYMAQAQDYALKVLVNHQLEEVTAIFATPLRVSENQDPVLSIKDKEYFELDRLVVKTRELRLTRNWADRQVFSCSFDWKSGRWLAPFPSYTFSMPTRFTAFELIQLYKLGKENSMLGFNVPLADSNFDECFLTLNMHTSLGGYVIEGVEESEVLSLGYETHEITREMVFPSLQVTGPKTSKLDSPIEFSVQIVDGVGNHLSQDAEIYFESINGYLPKPRKKTSNGHALIRVLPIGLEIGDTVRLKAGFKFYPALDDALVTIV